jgi:cell division GTPase FtsZ
MFHIEAHSAVPCAYIDGVESGVIMSISESRAACASTHFRVQYPNSRPRRIKVIGLGEGGGRIAQAIARRGYAEVDIIATGDYAKHHAETVVKGVTGDAKGLHRHLQEADMIFMVAVSGDEVDFARVVSCVARELGKLVTGVLIETGGGLFMQGRSTLDTLRASADMLVIGADESYLDEMLSELGAKAA